MPTRKSSQSGEGCCADFVDAEVERVVAKSEELKSMEEAQFSEEVDHRKYHPQSCKRNVGKHLHFL